jgi:transcriptional regulator with XRE-family HTH domain
MGLGSEIKAALKERKMSIKELSERTGISLNTLYAITKRDSTNVNMDIIMKIAKELDMDISSMLMTPKLEKVIELFTGPGDQYIDIFNKLTNDTSEKVLLVPKAYNTQSETHTERLLYFFNLLDDSAKEIAINIMADLRPLNNDGLLKAQERIFELSLVSIYKK